MSVRKLLSAADGDVSPVRRGSVRSKRGVGKAPSWVGGGTLGVRSRPYSRPAALEEQRNGEWRYLEFLRVTSLITAETFLHETPGGTRARQRPRPVGLPEYRYRPQRSERADTFRSVVPQGPDCCGPRGLNPPDTELSADGPMSAAVLSWGGSGSR
jgi:hypothetical protein